MLATHIKPFGLLLEDKGVWMELVLFDMASTTSYIVAEVESGL